MKIRKRMLLIFLSGVLCFSSVSITYYESTEAAEAVAGVVGFIAAHKILTALLVCGTVIAGGVAYDELSNASPADTQELINTIKDSFKGFVTEYEKELLIQQNVNMSQQEALDLAIEKAEDVVDNFTDNVLNANTTTGSDLETETVDLWQKYGEELNDAIDNYDGSSSGSGTMEPTTTFNPPVYNFSTNFPNASSLAMENVGANTIEYDGKYYVASGKYFSGINSSTGVVGQGTFSQPTNTDRYRFWFGIVSQYVGQNIKLSVNFIDVNRLTGQIITSKKDQYTAYFYYSSSITTDITEMVNTVLSNTNMPCLVIDSYTNEQSSFDGVVNNYNDFLPVNSGGSSLAEYIQLMLTIINSNAILKGITAGRRRLINDGDYVTSIFEDSYPIKKRNIVRDAETGTYTGEVGWDVPGADVWDDGLDNTDNFPRVVGDTGTVAVPKDGTGVVPGDTTVEVPGDTPVVDSNENTKNPDQPYPETTPDDIVDEQDGLFYPTEMDLTNVFPFCIPFDIIYLVDKFDVHGEEAPVLEIPIVYPDALHGTLGESYEVTIDFEDFLVVRNILRVFLLILFIVGLLKITRDLIRG